MSLVLSLLATLYPSWRAARLDPVRRCATAEPAMDGPPTPRAVICEGRAPLPPGRRASLEILRGAELAIWPGRGRWRSWRRPGAGKSTLLHVAGLLEKPDGGEVFVGGAPTAAMDDTEPHPPAPRGDRLRLPVPPPSAGILGARERGACPSSSAGSRKPEARARASRAPEVPRPRRAAQAPPGGAFRRRAAARRDRPRGRQRAAAAPCRRADRQPRPADGEPGVLDPQRASCAPRASPPWSRPTTSISRPAWTGGSRSEGVGPDARSATGSAAVRSPAEGRPSSWPPVGTGRVVAPVRLTRHAMHEVCR